MTTDDFTEDENVEIEFTDEDIAYFILDEDDNEIGIALYDEDGNEVEFYYAEGEEGIGIEIADDGEIEFIEDNDDAIDLSDVVEIELPDGGTLEVTLPSNDEEIDYEEDDETFEIEVSEDDIAYYIVDEDGNELGFALTEEDGTETEYYYEGIDGDAYETVAIDDEASEDASAITPVAHNAKSNGKQEPLARRAGEEVGKFATFAGAQAGKAAEAAKGTIRKMKEDATTKDGEQDEDLGFGLTAQGVKKAASDFTAMAKEGAEAAAELRSVYDDITEGLDFLKPRPGSRIRRR